MFFFLLFFLLFGYLRGWRCRKEFSGGGGGFGLVDNYQTDTHKSSSSTNSGFMRIRLVLVLEVMEVVGGIAC